MQEALAAVQDDIDPMKHAGEGFFATEEYPRPGDISDPYVRGDMLNEEDYYPAPDRKNKMRRY